MKCSFPNFGRLLALGFILVGTLAVSVKEDEVVTFFPTFAAPSPDGAHWRVTLHGWVYEPEDDSLSRRALLYLFTKRLGLSESAGESQLFRDRAKPFLVDNKRGRTVPIRVAGREFLLGPSAPNGHLSAALELSTAEVGAGGEERDEDNRRSLKVEVLPPGSGRPFSFFVPLLEAEGVSVISDIDDTVKVTGVGDTRAVLRNTFCDEFQAIPGMAALYRSWREQGAAFHYVSASPWQLQRTLAAFFQTAGFPAGTMGLKAFRWKDSSFFDLFAKSDEIKRPVIEELLHAFPRRTFILVGDSGEHDPELYGALARTYTTQVQRVYIRKASDADIPATRLAQAFSGVPAERWRLFSNPEELVENSRGLFER